MSKSELLRNTSTGKQCWRKMRPPTCFYCFRVSFNISRSIGVRLLEIRENPHFLLGITGWNGVLNINLLYSLRLKQSRAVVSDIFAIFKLFSWCVSQFLSSSVSLRTITIRHVFDECLQGGGVTMMSIYLLR